MIRPYFCCIILIRFAYTLQKGVKKCQDQEDPEDRAATADEGPEDRAEAVITAEASEAVITAEASEARRLRRRTEEGAACPAALLWL